MTHQTATRASLLFVTVLFVTPPEAVAVADPVRERTRTSGGTGSDETLGVLRPDTGSEHDPEIGVHLVTAPTSSFALLDNTAHLIERVSTSSATGVDQFRLLQGKRSGRRETDVAARLGWETLFAEDFEGAWPGGWEMYDLNFGSGYDYWARVNCAPAGGGSAAWCAGTGDQVVCGSSYDDDMRSWLIWGPFNLSDATAAEVELDFMNQSEAGYDRVGFLFSTDGVAFSGLFHWGTTPGYPSVWQNEVFDLRDVPILGDLADEPLVWLGILFESDSAVSSLGGAYVDNITVRAQRDNGCSISPASPPPNAEICFPQTFTWSVAGDCDDLWMGFTTDPTSSDVIIIPVSGSQTELERWQWAEINLWTQGAPTYYWTIGELYGAYYFERAPWQAFTVCLPCPSDGACCTPHPTVGCDDAMCCESVCATDGTCCEFQWDSTCATLASQLCGCLLCGNGDCGPGETCASCPADCTYVGSSNDCNSNTIPDGCDIQVDTSNDCNLDGIPDECLGTICPPFQDNDAFTTTDTRLYKLNLATGAQTLVAHFATLRWMYGLAIDPTNGDLYGIEEDAVAIIDPQDGGVQVIGNHGLFLLDTRRGLGFDNAGVLFLVHEGNTYAINKATGVASLLGPNSLTHDSALTFSSDGQMFAVGEVDALNGLPGLVRLNSSTGALEEVIGVVPDGIGGLDFDSRGVLYATSFTSNTVYALSVADATARVISTFALGGSSLAVFRDCNHNAAFDPHDIDTAFSQDNNGDGIPDECSYCGNGTCDSSEHICDCPQDCGSPTPAELAGVSCTDDIDNDCDGAKDCGDNNCTFDDACLPPPTRGGPGDMILSGPGDFVGRVDGVTGHLLHTFPPGPDLHGAEGAIIGPDGELYVVSRSNRAVIKFDLRNGFRYGFFVASESGGLNAPMDLCFGPDNNLYVADYSRDNVLRFNGSTGAFMNKFVNDGAGGLFRPRSLAFGPDGNLYVSSVDTHSILRFDGQTGAFINAFVPSQSGGLLAPYGFTFGPDGHLYVAQGTTQGAVYRYNGTTGAFMNIFVTFYPGVLRNPKGIAFGPDGDLYVTSDIGQVFRCDGETGALVEGAAFTSGDHLMFQPAECFEDGDCDDANPSTEDTCFSHACKHPARSRYYVSAMANGADDGTSWADAFTDLQDALAAALAGGFPAEVWVAAGVYTPDAGSGDRLATFQLLDGVSLYGGFFGGETEISQREPELNLTVLSGDLLGNDGAAFTNYAENSYHVVTASATGFDAPTIIDGFVITGGNANGPSFESGFRNIGGGMFVLAGNSTVVGCRFVANRASSGGGLRTKNSPSRINVINSVFSGNQAFSSSGGGVAGESNIYFTFTNVVFTGNTATGGSGGGASLVGRATFTNCTLTANHSTVDGGGIYNTEAFTDVANSILWGNTDPGGSDQSAQLGGSSWRIRDSCVQGWTGALGGMGNTGDCEPHFINPPGRDGSPGTVDDNVRVQPPSANIDAGISWVDTDANRAGVQALPATDIAGMPRVLNSKPDRGAYEYQLPVPTVSAWGAAILGLALAAAGTIIAPRARRTLSRGGI